MTQPTQESFARIQRMQHYAPSGFALKALSALLLAWVLPGCSNVGDTFTGFTIPSDNQSIECTQACISVQLVAGRVAGLNYECDDGSKGRGVTAFDGFAKCPSNSTISYYIRSSEQTITNRINLGSYALEGIDNGVQQITPYDLIPATTSSGITTLDAQNTIVAVLTSLAGTIAVNKKVNANNITSMEVEITDDLKNQLAKIGVDTAKAGSSTFVDEVNNWLSTPIDTNLAFSDIKTKLTNAVNSGVYASNSVLSAKSIDANGELTTYGRNLNSGNSANTSVVQLNQIQNRTGQTLGQGLIWDASENVANAQLTTMTARFGFAKFSLQVSSPTVSEDKVLTRHIWSNPNGRSFSVTAGKFDSGNIVYGSKSLFNTRNGQQVDAVVAPDVLGKWSGNFVNSYSSQPLTLFKISPLESYFPAGLWRTTHTVATGKTTIFPLALTLSLSCGSNCTISNAANNTDIGVLILENGNIVTDGDNGQIDCSPVNETNLGVVRLADYKNADRTYMTLAMMWSDKVKFGEQLDGLQLGSESFVIQNPNNDVVSKYKTVLDMTSFINKIEQIEAGGFVVKASDLTGLIRLRAFNSQTLIDDSDAVWINMYSFATNLLAGSSSGGTAKIDNQEVSNITALKGKDSGTATATLSSCYTPGIAN